MAADTGTTTARLRGLRIGTVFGAAWFAVGVVALHPGWRVPATVVGAVVLVAIVVRLARLQRAARRDAGADARMRSRAFLLVTLTEVVGVVAAVVVGRALDRSELIAPLIMLVVGLHFVPLARLFRVPRYTLLAAAMSLAAVAIVVVDSAQRHSGQSLRAVSGLVSGALLWISVLSALLSDR